MILDFYNLREQPFGVTPDPRYLYLSPTHREALSSLKYGIQEKRGFMGLIAQPGMGKTTLLFHLLKEMGPTARTVFLFQTQRTPHEFLSSLVSDLGLDGSCADLPRLQSLLNDFLIREAHAGRRFVLVVDEAQNLEEPILEVLRMLSNFESSTDKLMQIILAGQPQLADKLMSSSLVQLRQRISILGRLNPFTAKETNRYIFHRLKVAGCDCESTLFTSQARTLIYKYSGGIPRNINNLCFNALSLGCALRKESIDHVVLREVVEDLNWAALGTKSTPPLSWVHPFVRRSKVKLGAEFGSWRRTWSWKHAAAISAVLLVGVASFASMGRHRLVGKNKAPVVLPAEELHTGSSAIAGYKNSGAPSPTSSISPINATAFPVADSEVRIAGDDGSSRTITIGPSQTLSSISVENTGEYNARMLERFRALNPWINDPDHIRTGQALRIPTSDKGSAHKLSETKSENSDTGDAKP
jgi:type II secretory pathway predicted ATPase ExeA